MKQVLTILLSMNNSGNGLTSGEIGPEGHKLVWILAFLIGMILVMAWFYGWDKSSERFKFPFLKRHKVRVDLAKDRLYYPRFLELKVFNRGNNDIDLGNPVLVLSSIWVTRKFKLKGTNKNWFYPLYLPKNQSHCLNIDLSRFYGFDKTLKRLPRARVVVTDVKGRKLGSRRVLLRKTLFNF